MSTSIAESMTAKPQGPASIADVVSAKTPDAKAAAPTGKKRGPGALSRSRAALTELRPIGWLTQGNLAYVNADGKRREVPAGKLVNDLSEFDCRGFLKRGVISVVYEGSENPELFTGGFAETEPAAAEG